MNPRVPVSRVPSAVTLRGMRGDCHSNEWAALKALVRLDQTAGQLVREAIDPLLKKYGAKSTNEGGGR